MITNNPFEELAIQLRHIAIKQEETNAKLEKILQADKTDDELITRAEKAKQLDVSLPTLKNWEDQGLIEPPTRIGRRVYFRRGMEHPKAKIIE
jgi:primosomal protein N'